MAKCLYCFNEADPQDPAGRCPQCIANEDDEDWEWIDENGKLDKEPFAWTMELEASANLFHKLADNGKCIPGCGADLLAVGDEVYCPHCDVGPDVEPDADGHIKYCVKCKTKLDSVYPYDFCPKCMSNDPSILDKQKHFYDIYRHIANKFGPPKTDPGESPPIVWVSHGYKVKLTFHPDASFDVITLRGGILEDAWQDSGSKQDLDRMLDNLGKAEKPQTQTPKQEQTFDFEEYNTKLPGSPQKYKLSQLLELASTFHKLTNC